MFFFVVCTLAAFKKKETISIATGKFNYVSLSLSLFLDNLLAHSIAVESQNLNFILNISI